MSIVFDSPSSLREFRQRFMNKSTDRRFMNKSTDRRFMNKSTGKKNNRFMNAKIGMNKSTDRKPIIRTFSESDMVLTTDLNGARETKEIIKRNDNGRISEMEIDNGRIVMSNVFPRTKRVRIQKSRTHRTPRRIQRTTTPFYQRSNKRRRTHRRR